jgi:KDO2-lipid IV(A) lauroyltransferase
LGRLFTEILTQGWNVPGSLAAARYEGWHRLQQVASSGRGYFLLSGHFGNWERVACLQGALGHPLWMIVRPLDNPLLERFFAELREATGNRVVHKRNAVREMVRGLKAGKGIAIVIDQNFGEAARLFVPFFGRPAATTPVLGSLAVRLRVPILPVFSFPEEGGRYRIAYGEPFEAPDTGDPAADALEVTRKATDLIEQAVRACPGAWFWMHRRWRTRPEPPGLEEPGGSG